MRHRWALITGSATLDEQSYRTKRPKHPNHNAFDKSGIDSKFPKVVDAMIEADRSTSIRISISSSRIFPEFSQNFPKLRQRLWATVSLCITPLYR